MKNALTFHFPLSFFRVAAVERLIKVIVHQPACVKLRGVLSGKSGGTLRRGWTAGQNSNARAYAESLSVHRVGTDFVIDIINPVEYASYVEFGHRTSNHKNWVEGKFMLTLSEKEIASMAPKILERKLEDYLRRCFS